MTAVLLCAVAGLLQAGAGDVDLDALAARYGLTRSSDAATGREVLRGPGATLSIAPGLSTALWNGEARALSCPVRIEGGRVVAPRDVAALFADRPVRARSDPPKPAAPRGFRIVIDPGHGGVHTGGRSRGGLMEKDVVLDVALHLARLLEADGVEVRLTRSADTQFAAHVDDDLERRVEVANRARPDVFMSIHANWHPGAHARGFEVFVPRHADRARAGSLAMAQEIEALFRSRLDTEDRGIKEAGFRVLRGTTAPAVLVELEFLSNDRGERELGDPEHRRKLAVLLFEAVKRYIARR